MMEIILAIFGFFAEFYRKHPPTKFERKNTNWFLIIIPVLFIAVVLIMFDLFWL